MRQIKKNRPANISRSNLPPGRTFGNNSNPYDVDIFHPYHPDNPTNPYAVNKSHPFHPHNPANPFAHKPDSDACTNPKGEQVYSESREQKPDGTS